MAIIGDLSGAERALLTATVAGRITGTILGRDASLAGGSVETDVASAAVAYLIDAAPRTPDDIGREAAIRFAAWIYGQPAHLSERSEKDPSGTELTTRHTAFATANGFRSSGASALVSRYIVRRGGVIGEPC